MLSRRISYALFSIHSSASGGLPFEIFITVWALGAPPSTVEYKVHGRRGEGREPIAVCPIISGAPGSDIESIRYLLCACSWMSVCLGVSCRSCVCFVG